MAEQRRTYLKGECVESLHTYLEIGKETLLGAGTGAVRNLLHLFSDWGSRLLRREENGLGSGYCFSSLHLEREECSSVT